jgi:hypothetical protein
MRSGVGELSNGSVNERECECARDATRACARRVVGKRVKKGAERRHRQMATPARRRGLLVLGADRRGVRVP